MPTCIYCGVVFSTAKAEHILHNSLGARWTSSQIVCDQHQTLFGQTIDLELHKQTMVFRNLFDHKSGRRNPAPTLINLETDEGKLVNLEPGGVLRIQRPEIVISDHPTLPDAKSVQLRYNLKDVDWALHLLHKALPKATISVEDIQKHAQPSKSAVGDVIKLQAPYGGHEYHRSTGKAVFNLAGASGVPLADSCFDGFRKFVAYGEGDSADFVRFASRHDFVPKTKLGEIDHFIAVVARDSLVEGYVQLYGGIQYVMKIASGYHGEPFAHGYLVNPRRDTEIAETRTPVFDAALLPSFQQHPRLPNESTMAWMTEKLNKLMAYYFSEARMCRMKELIDVIVKKHAGKPFTPELNREIAEEIALEFAAMMKT